MFWRARTFWLSVGVVAYAASAALRASGGSPARGALAILALALMPALLAVVWTITDGERSSMRQVSAAARSAARAAATGVAIAVAARTGPADALLDALGNAGVGVTAFASLVALGRITGPRGMVEPPPQARSLDAAAFSALLWTVATALPAVVAASSERARAVDPLMLDGATVAASLGTLGLQLASAARVRALRRLEPGVGDRAWAALCLSLTATAIGIGGAVVGVLPPERVLPLAALAAAASVVLTVASPEPTQVSRGLRITLAVSVLCAPLALFAVYIAAQAPAQAGAVVFLACTGTALGGLAAPLVARWFAPEAARWLSAFEAATRAAMNPDPDAALEHALSELRDASGRIFRARPWGLPPRKPEPKRGKRTSRRAIATVMPHDPDAPPETAALYRIVSGDMVSMDRAGYMQLQKASVPQRLVDLCTGEPEAVLSAEALRAVEVRRPEVRPMLAWLEQRNVAVAALLGDESGPIGMLTVPRGARTAPLTLEELRALRALADRLAAVLGVSAMLSRSRQREAEARAEAEGQRVRADEAARSLGAQTSRLQALARALERPARAAAYGPAARTAVEELERLAASARAVTLLAAPGVNVAAWVALVHLASPRGAGVLVLVDGTDPVHHDLARWRDDEASPLRVASGGTLGVLDAHALPGAVQSWLAAATPDDTGLVVSVPATVDSLVATGRFDERLADRIGDRAVALPVLANRGEDLRGLCIDHLARMGVRLSGQPMGIDTPALALLAEHAWPGNDVELEALLLRAARAATGNVIGVRELSAAGFSPVAAERGPERSARSAGPIPITRRRRRS
jgi:hypothetical protein